METKRTAVSNNKRAWERLPVSMPVFVGRIDGDATQRPQLGTALNISAGGALIATRRFLSLNAHLILEFPCAPGMPERTLSHSVRTVKGFVVRILTYDSWHLSGVSFDLPLAGLSASKEN